MNSIEKLEKEFLAKKAELERNIALAKQLPTNGLTFSWTGDGGYIGNDKQLDTIKSVPLEPWIFHSAFRGAQSVAYKAPDEYPDYGDLAKAMRVAYVRAVCAAYAPFLIDILALKGTYASNMHCKFDWEHHRDYSDAEVVGRGKAEITVDASVEHSSGPPKLKFYADLPHAGVVEVRLDIPYAQQLAPRAEGVKRYQGRVISVERWTVPSHTAVNVWKRGSGGYPNMHYTLEYLYEDMDAALRAAGIEP